MSDWVGMTRHSSLFLVPPDKTLSRFSIHHCKILWHVDSQTDEKANAVWFQLANVVTGL